MSDAPLLLADPAVLGRRVGKAADDQLVLDALERASDRFRGEVRHQVNRVTETLIVNGPGGYDLRLPVAYVTDVERVTVLGTPVTVDWDEYGLVNRADGQPWPLKRRAVEITLTHGFENIPGDIADAVLEQAEAQHRVLAGISSKQVGGITQAFDNQAVGTTPTWNRTVKRYRIRVGDRA